MMKTTIKLLALAFVLFATACSNDDEYDMLNSLWRNVTQNEARIDALEKWCAQANTNITSLQTIVNVIESNGMVTSITPVMEGGVEIGYTITFSNHDPITIYHGKDGKDGQNGANGQNGTSPIVGVAKYTDGVYYWTLNGEWLLDADGNKLTVSGKDGANGENGQNGSNGQNGVTPQLKIENDYWWISYDNGSTWTQLGKAKGEDGENGQNGAKGDKGDTGDKGDKGDKGDAGDSMFQSVTQDADNVYFTLANGTVITIAKGGGGADQPNSDFLFTITYMPNGAVGEIIKDTVCYGDTYTLRVDTFFTKEGYYFATWNTKSDGTGLDYGAERVLYSISRNITLYAQWVKEGDNYAMDLGLSVNWATCNVGATKAEEYGNYYAWGETTPKTTYSWSTYKWCNGSKNTMTKYCTDSDYGTVDNKTVLDKEDDAASVNMGGSWRMPTYEELSELKTKCTWTWTTRNSVKGYLVTSKTNGNSIFLPAAGYRYGSDLSYAGSSGDVWSSSLSTDTSDYAYDLYFNSDNVYWYYGSRYYGRSVRGVCP